MHDRDQAAAEAQAEKDAEPAPSIGDLAYNRLVNARIEERYTRTGPDTIELRLTLYDPALYTQPWVSDVKTYTRIPRQETTFYGWYGLFSGLTEGICAPMNEVDSYNSLFRDRTSQGVIK